MVFHKRKRVYLLCFLLGQFGVLAPIQAQTYQLTKKLPLNNIIHATFDRKKNIYVADADGNVIQFDSTAKKVNIYSPEKLGVITSMVTSQTLQLFLFYQDFQEYVILDRFLNEITRQSIALPTVGYVKQAALASDNNVWIFDEGDMSIKKYNPKINKIIAHTSLDLSLGVKLNEVIHLQEHENLLYLFEKTTGIWVFDNLGSFKKRLPYLNLQSFSLARSYLYWWKNKKLTKINIYNKQEQPVSITLDNVPKVQKSRLLTPFITSSLLFIVTSSQLLIYQKNK
ncbi:hypothetical protein [Microscilla marina]|uniref:Uncharacterized protein n=1 Tax=Microscilla marina ATCC 23134 TaxID=313606 RepID=A1ZF00_MICM2|nr:hypothetical protein [Microscilla marina]EAY31102.1 hypothetical protein M23134_07510 [Microscilla marina ATCC 23134]